MMFVCASANLLCIVHSQIYIRLLTTIRSHDKASVVTKTLVNFINVKSICLGAQL